MNDSLRVGAETDIAVGQHAGVATPIQVLEFRKPGELPSLLRSVLDQHGFAKQGFVVLAHSGNDARRASGSIVTAGTGRGRVIQIADAARIVRIKHADQRLLIRAIENVERLLSRRGLINHLNWSA